MFVACPQLRQDGFGGLTLQIYNVFQHTNWIVTDFYYLCLKYQI